MVGAQDENPVLHPPPRGFDVDPSSAAGSSTTTEPVQVNSVEIALVVLKEPEPAIDKRCVDPSTQGSIRSGARPPWPHALRETRSSALSPGVRLGLAEAGPLARLAQTPPKFYY